MQKIEKKSEDEARERGSSARCWRKERREVSRELELAMRVCRGALSSRRELLPGISINGCLHCADGSYDDVLNGPRNANVGEVAPHLYKTGLVSLPWLFHGSPLGGVYFYAPPSSCDSRQEVYASGMCVWGNTLRIFNWSPWDRNGNCVKYVVPWDPIKIKSTATILPGHARSPRLHNAEDTSDALFASVSSSFHNVRKIKELFEWIVVPFRGWEIRDICIQSSLKLCILIT